MCIVRYRWLADTMIGIEMGVTGVHLSEADSHFCSSHGANCGGWDNYYALDQMKSRGVANTFDRCDGGVKEGGGPGGAR